MQQKEDSRIVALVIGNNNYPNAPLTNAVNDASDISDIFRRLGFKVTTLLDATCVEQEKAIIEFGQNLDSFDAAIFYFAGHGFQIKDENFLAAVDLNTVDEIHAKRTSLPLNLVLDYISTRGAKTNILILDTCRENLNFGWYRTVNGNNIAPIFAPQGTVIAFATSPGQRAKDGTGRNGLYTNALLQHIVEPHLPVEEIFKRVRSSVFSNSSGTQVTWEHTSLIGTFCFNNGHLGYSSEIIYSEIVVKDALYDSTKISDFNSIINKLKSHSYYTQNPAIDVFLELNPESLNFNEKFLIGRNILQAADGGSFHAWSLINNLDHKLSIYNEKGGNHILNGMLFETYFNSYGSFRYENIKRKCLNELLSFSDNPEYNLSLDFIKTALIPFQDFLCYIPGIQISGISINVFLEGFDEEEKVAKLKYATLDGRNILTEYDDPFASDQFPQKILQGEIKQYISDRLFIPINKLKLSYNITVSEDTNIVLPADKILSKPQIISFL